MNGAAPDFAWAGQGPVGPPAEHWTGNETNPAIPPVFFPSEVEIDQAFQLDGTIIPEPASLTVCGVSGVVLLGAFVRRRWRARKRKVGDEVTV